MSEQETYNRFREYMESEKYREAVEFKDSLSEEDQAPLKDFDKLNEIIFREKRINI